MPKTEHCGVCKKDMVMTWRRTEDGGTEAICSGCNKSVIYRPNFARF